MWQRWKETRDDRELIRLEVYNQEDVKLLAKLVQLPRVLLPRGGSTNLLKIALRVAAFLSFSPESPQSLQQGSEAWFAFRKNKISASTAAAFLRLDFRTTREQQFERLIGEEDGPQETPAMRRGVQHEDGICHAYANAMDAELSTTGSWPHSEFGDWLFASPDRLVSHPELRKLALLEVKSVGRISQTIPNAHLIQVQLQLECGRQFAFCDYVQSDGTQIVVHRVRRDTELVGVILGHLNSVYEAARPALEGGTSADDVFVDDVAAIGRAEQLELMDLLDECRRIFCDRCV